MLGTIINSTTIILGSLLGMFLKNFLKEKYQTSIMQVLALATFAIGLNDVIKNIEDANMVVFLLSLVIGTFVGEFLCIEDRINNFGLLVEKKFASNKSNTTNDFSKGFVTASLIFSVGTMGILGSFESGLKNNHSILIIKSILDGISSVVFASIFGIGVMLSAIVVFIYQGALTVLASYIAPYITSEMYTHISLIGGLLIAGIGLNILKICNFKIANMTVSILIPIIYYSIV